MFSMDLNMFLNMKIKMETGSMRVGMLNPPRDEVRNAMLSCMIYALMFQTTAKFVVIFPPSTFHASWLKIT
ncbi:hypothetical protein AAZX31_U021100 [Glycine max]